MFRWHDITFLRRPYSWIIVSVVAIITIFYYVLQFFRVSTFAFLPLSHTLVIWEYLHNLNGSLFYVPLLLSILLIWWRGALIIWLVTMVIITPRVVYLYNSDLGWIFNNLFYLSLPVLLSAIIGIEIKWREKQRKAASERERERQNYLAQVFKAQEDERMRIAQEIHDDSIQRLTAIAINANLLKENQDMTPALKMGMESIRDMVILASEDLRRITLDLRPTVLDDLGLVSALRWLVDNFKQENGIDAQIEIIGDNNQLSKKYSTNIFRVVQEALNNVRKHSEASRVIMHVQFNEKSILLKIQDNGKGFIVPRKNAELIAKGKLGIIGMQQRAKSLNGTTVIQSDLGKGTTVSFKFDL